LSGGYSAQQTLAGGLASFAIGAGSLSIGANVLTAAYSGDTNYSSAIGTGSVTVAQVVIAVPTPVPLTPGESAAGTVTLSAGSTYSGTMNLACTLTGVSNGAQSAPTCSLSPASVAIAAGGSGTAVLTIATTAASTASLARPFVRPFKRNRWTLGGGDAALAGLLIFAIPSRRRRWMSLWVLLWVVVGVGTIGCGRSSQFPVQTPPSTKPATTAGTYTFTVTATDSVNATITASTTVVVTVQ